MDLSMEQRLAVRFCLKAGKRATESLQMVNTAYGAKHYPIRKFSDGMDDFAIHLKTVKTTRVVAGLQSVEMTTLFSQLLLQNSQLLLRMLAHEVNISKGTAKNTVVEDLRKRKIRSRFVPETLTPEQKVRPTTRQS
jgi:hypothetical protein